MSQAAPALSAPLQGRNPPPALNPQTAALHAEWAAAVAVWVTLPAGSRREEKARAHLLELKGRLNRMASTSRQEVRHV